MINYFAAAEKTLRARGQFEKALENLERRKERIVARGGPSGYPSMDLTKPYASTGEVNDALSVCLALAEVEREIADTERALVEVDAVLAQLSVEDEKLLQLWYIQQHSKDEVSEIMGYTSASHIYELRNRAVAAFALLYFGAGALRSY